MILKSDKELVEEVLSGKTDVFSELVSRYTRTALGVASRIVQNKHTAEDIAQEAFVISFERLKTLKDRNSFGPWLLQITRNQAINEVRNNKRVLSLTNVTSDPVLDRNGQLEEKMQELLSLIEKLPDHEQIVISLKYFDGNTIENIAGITGQSVGTVTKKLTRARKRLISFVENKNHEK